MKTDLKTLLSCLSGKKSKKTTQTRLVRFVDRLLSFDYEILQISGKNMELMDELSRHLLGLAPRITELNNAYVVAQVNAISSLFKPAAKVSTSDKDKQNNVIGCANQNCK